MEQSFTKVNRLLDETRAGHRYWLARAIGYALGGYLRCSHRRNVGDKKGPYLQAQYPARKGIDVKANAINAVGMRKAEGTNTATPRRRSTRPALKRTGTAITPRNALPDKTSRVGRCFMLQT